MTLVEEVLWEARHAGLSQKMATAIKDCFHLARIADPAQNDQLLMRVAIINMQLKLNRARKHKKPEIRKTISLMETLNSCRFDCHRMTHHWEK